MNEKEGMLRDEVAEQAPAGLANRGLKIVKVDAHCIKWTPGSVLSWLIVRVETEEGYVGFGEATAYPVTPVYGWLQVFGQALVGESAWDIERLWTAQRDQYTHGSATQAALSAFDIAFWDIIGQRLNVPVYALLGGKVNPRVPIYHHPWGRGIESYAEATAALVREGVMAGKLDPFRSRGFARELTREELDEAVDIVRGIREGGGKSFTICVEMHGRFNVATAIRVADAMRPYDPLFIEEPVPATNVGAMREVQLATTLAVATGERIRSTVEYGPYLERKACRILQPDVGHMGGITGLKRLAHAADDHYVTIAPHCCWGPVQAMASAHVSSTIPNLLIQEDNHWRTGIFEETVVGGYTFDPQYIDVPEVSGLGVRLSPELLRDLAIDAARADAEYLKQHMTGVRGY
jgi:galactonate dehydratase